MLPDFRFAARSLIKSPGFALITVLILALGIASVTTVFTAVDAVLLRPYPYTQADRLVMIDSAVPNQAGLFSVAEYCVCRDQVRSIQGLAAISNFNSNFVDNGQAQLAQGIKISAGAFEMLGVRPQLGRLLVPSDDRPGAPKVIVIGSSLWQRAYGGRTDILGRTVSVDGDSFQIVGVLPSGFVLPLNSFHGDICLPMQADSDPTRFQHGALHYLRVIGRLAPGLTPAQAAEDMQSVLAPLRRQYPQEYGGSGHYVVTAFAEGVVRRSRPMLLTLFGSVAALLLLASTNLAGLHLVRAVGREREFGVRAALGASRTQLARLILTECLVLAVAGGAAGLLLSAWAVRSLMAFVPADLPRGHDIQFDGSVFAFIALATAAFGLLPALGPLWLISRHGVSQSLATGGRGAIGGQRKMGARLASVQVALTVALLVGTALFLRSFWAVGKEQLGFDSHSSRIVTARLTLPEATYPDRRSLTTLYQHIHARLAAAPGIDRAGEASLLPLAEGLASINFQLAGQPTDRPDDLPTANYRLISPEYFDAMGIHLREGRFFTERDDASRPLLVIVGASLADKFFPRHDAVGHQLELQDTLVGYRTATIAGVVNDVKQGKLEDAPTFDVWVPLPQMDPVAVRWVRYRSYWVVRGSATAAELERSLQDEVNAEDRSIAVASVRTLEDVTDHAKSGRRFTLILIGFFAGVALLLTISGIYSVIAFGVVQRRREIGVRLALGARAEQILGLILGEGLIIALWGAAAGAIVSLLLGQLIAVQLYDVGPKDPSALSSAIFMVVAVAMLASWLPARRAARIDPMVALRSE
ncbi:MAG TPA: ABC transporter permease [Opitutaceae bacterium]|jgi:putative ABC transport system permease protein